MNVSELARRHGVSHSYLGKRLRAGMSVEEAIKPPASRSQRGRMSKAKGHWNTRLCCASKSFLSLVSEQPPRDDSNSFK